MSQDNSHCRNENCGSATQATRYTKDYMSDGSQPAKSLIEDLIRQGVGVRQIAKDIMTCEENLQAILSGEQQPDPTTAAKLARLHEQFPSVYGPFLHANAQSIKYINELADIGFTERQIARAVGVCAPRLSKILRGHEKAPKRLPAVLEELYREQALAKTRRAATVRNAPARLAAACKSPGVSIDAAYERVTQSVRAAVLNHYVADRHERIPLPEGYPAVVVSLHDDLLVVACDQDQCRDAQGNALAHEYEFLAQWFQAKAREARGVAGGPGRVKPRRVAAW